jgi:hypothetical protein
MADNDCTQTNGTRRGHTVAQGIRLHGKSLQARVKVAGRTALRSFAVETPLRDIERWRQIARGQLLDDGRFDEDTAAYYGRNLLTAVQTLPPIGTHPQAFVYFIQAGPYLKIGVARNPFERMADLQTSHPEDLRLVGAILCLTPHAVEGALHRRFLDRRKRGEWFALDVRLVAFVQDVQAGRIQESDCVRKQPT